MTEENMVKELRLKERDEERNYFIKEKSKMN